jgi:cell division septum initiation protein DivIVA
MYTPRRSLSILLAAGALVATGLTACGGDSRNEELQRQGAELQQQAQQYREKTERAAEEVRNGTRSAEDVAGEASADAEKLVDDAKETTSEVIDTVKEDSRLPDEAVDQLEDAQQQLEQPTP